MEEATLNQLADKIVARILYCMPDADQFLTAKQIAERTGYSKASVNKIIAQMKERELPGLVRIGDRVTRVSWNAFTRFLTEERKVTQ